VNDYAILGMFCIMELIKVTAPFSFKLHPDVYVAKYVRNSEVGIVSISY